MLEKSYHVHQMNRRLANPELIAHKQVDVTLTLLSSSACTLDILALVWTARTCFALSPVDLSVVKGTPRGHWGGRGFHSEFQLLHSWVLTKGGTKTYAEGSC